MKGGDSEESAYRDGALGVAQVSEHYVQQVVGQLVKVLQGKHLKGQNVAVALVVTNLTDDAHH